MIALIFSLLFSAVASAGVVEEVAALAEFRSLRGPENAPTISPEDYERAVRSPVSGIVSVPDVSAAQAWGVSVFQLPIEQVWQGLTTEGEHAGTAAPVSVSKVIAGQPHVDGRLLFQFMPLPLVTDRWWVVRIKHNRKLYEASQGKMWELYWFDENSAGHLTDPSLKQTAADGMPVAWTKGAWLLTKLDENRTLVEYYAWSDPGGRLPAGPASRFAGGAVTETLASMEAFCKKLVGRSRTGYYRPDGSPL